jgi:hypothetical protein
MRLWFCDTPAAFAKFELEALPTLLILLLFIWLPELIPLLDLVAVLFVLLFPFDVPLRGREKKFCFYT